MAVTTIKVTREDALELMTFLTWGVAKNWDNERLGQKLSEIRDVVPDNKEPESEEVSKTLIDVLAGIEEGSNFEIVDEVSESEDDFSEEEEDENEIDFDDDDDEESEVEPNDEDLEEGNESEDVPDPEEESVDKEPKEEEPEVVGKKHKKKRKPRKKKEPEKEKEPDLYYQTLATDVPKFVVHDNDIFDEVGDSLNTDHYVIAPDLTIAEAKEYLRANVENRPYRKGIAKRYAEDILRNKWKRTLEPGTFDTEGKAVSLQHRLRGFILAEEKRLMDPEHYEEVYGWTGEITMPIALAFGADPEGNDLQDRGQQRTGADVLYRRAEFADVKESVLKKLSRDLAIAARLCWLKLGGRDVSDAPHFPHSEMLDFLEKHPRLKEMVLFVYNEDGGKDKKIVTYLKSRGYFAALTYLFGISETNLETIQKDDVSVDWDYSKWDTSQDFVSKFAAGIFEDENDPILQLRDWLTREMAKEKTPSRDVKVNMIIKVWKAYVAGESLEPKQMKFKRKEDFSIGNLV